MIKLKISNPSVSNSLINMKPLIYKIPPNLPLPKGGFSPLFGKEGSGEIFWINVNSIMRPLIGVDEFIESPP